MPKKSHEAVNRVANQLCDQDKSAGSNISCVVDEEPEPFEANYSLGKTYGGSAKREIKPPWRNRPNNGNRPNYQPRGRRLCPDWMKGVKGCFVCGQDHRANTRHSNEEVKKAIDRLKAAHPKALLTIEDLSSVVNMTTYDDDNDDVRWLDDLEDEDNDEIVMMAREDVKMLETALANNAFEHGRSLGGDLDEALLTMNQHIRHSGREEFKGVTIDTGANRKSVMCISQYKAYEQEFGRKIPIKPSKKKGLKGIGGQGEVVGEVTIQIPFQKLGLIIDVDFAVLKGECPSLLSNKDMLQNNLDISLQGRYIHVGDRRQPLALENFFFIHKWSCNDTPYALFTEDELRKIHRGFGHPSVKASYHLLRRANPDTLPPQTLKELNKISRDCKTCLKYAQAPRRFRLTIGAEKLRFNHRVVVDTMFINNKPILHMVDEATHFSAACFLRNQSTSEIWKCIRKLWILTYMGPPDFLTVDQGTAYVSKEMKNNIAAAGIVLEEAPIENPGTIGVVERYHAPLKRAYLKIRATLTKPDANDDECLQMAIYASNTTIGPEGLCPMLLVFGALPRPARQAPSPTQLDRQLAIESAKKEVQQEQAARRIKFALKHTHMPKPGETNDDLMDVPSGSPVVV